MASSSSARPGRSLLVLLVVLVALGAWMVVSGHNTPKLGLDLKGGTTVTLQPSPVPGEEGQVTDEAINQAVSIIQQRVDGSGVAEATVTAQGHGASAVIVVSVPDVGEDELVSQLGQTASLTFRPVLASTSGVPAPTPTPTPTPTSTKSGGKNNGGGGGNGGGGNNNGSLLPRLGPNGGNNNGGGGNGGNNPGGNNNGGGQSATPTATPTPTPTDTSGAGSISPELQQQFTQLDCSDPKQANIGQTFKKTENAIACSKDGAEKFILGPVAVDGANIDGATAGIPQNGTSWAVNLNFDGAGTKAFGDATTALSKLQPPLNRFAIVLDGVVVSAPSLNNGPILGGQAEITGSFNQQSATDLANILKFGALPLNFEIVERQTISPTLGSDQLHAGLVAGALGLILVVIYLIVYYRALSLVAIFSLIVAGALTYGTVVLLGQTMGFTLTLAGVAGLIVAIGITADSFIVYFERIRDEVREGRTMRVALESGWLRARRTIVTADFISLLAAVVLYFLSVGSVRGFAFTLGLTTIIDLIVVFLFTKPLVTILARTKFFSSGSKWSGLSPERLGARQSSAEKTTVASRRRAAAKGA